MTQGTALAGSEASPTGRESPDVRADRGRAWQRRAHDGLIWLAQRLPGVAMAAGLAAAGSALARWIGIDLLGYASSPISPILLTVLLGLAVRNLVGLPAVYESGVRVCLTQLLRIGVALLGIRLSVVGAGITGLVALPVVLVTIGSALLLVSGVNRLLGLPRRLGSLIAIGTSICGITAIVASAPVINADEDETSYAVATIALFGTAALFTYPFLAHLLFDDPYKVGLFLGTAIHDTSQVAGAGLAYDQRFGSPTALETAMVTKLVRNLCMIGVIPLISVLYHHRAGAARTRSASSRFAGTVPLFVVAFLAMTIFRTIGDFGSRPFGWVDPADWMHVIRLVERTSEIGLVLAMAGVGLSTDIRRLRSLGIRPLAVGLAAALCVGLVSAVLIRFLATLSFM